MLCAKKTAAATADMPQRRRLVMNLMISNSPLAELRDARSSSHTVTRRSVFRLQHHQLAFYCISNGGDRVGWSGDTAAEPAGGSSNQSLSSRSEPAISTLVDSSQGKLSQMLNGVTGQVVWRCCGIERDGTVRPLRAWIREAARLMQWCAATCSPHPARRRERPAQSRRGTAACRW
jgi:hypothetical protein